MDDPTPRLIADVGGTHARFAWQAARGAALEHLATLRCADHASLEDAIGHYLAPLRAAGHAAPRSEEHTSELQSL